MGFAPGLGAAITALEQNAFSSHLFRHKIARQPFDCSAAM